MVLSRIFALIICSVVIACGSSCDNDGNVTAQDVKYFKASRGFFYKHSLTNGESVVMYQILGEKISVQYTFINDDCLYETQSYNIENGTIKDHVKVEATRDEFSISKILSYIVCDKDSSPNENRVCKTVEIKFEINKTGFVLDNAEDQLFSTIYSEKNNVKLNQLVCKNGVDPNELSGFEIIDKDDFELTYMKNGRFFYQKTWESDCGESFYVKGRYALKSSNGFHVVNYDDFNFHTFGSNFKRVDDKDFRDEFLLEAKFQDKKEFVYFCFNSTGLSITFLPSIGTKQTITGQSPPSQEYSRASFVLS